MPAGMQKVEGQLPGPPALRSAVMSSQIFLYSGVSGGWPASGIQLFGVPGPRIHCPLKFGYFPKSTTWAADGVANSAINATAPKILGPSNLRTCMRCPPYNRPIGAEHPPSALMLLAVDGRKKSRPSSCPTIHRPPAAVEGPPHSLKGTLGLRPAAMETLNAGAPAVFNHPGRFHNAAPSQEGPP